MDNSPYNEYLLIMPSGNCRGFNDLEAAKAYINLYYERRIDHDLRHDGYNDATDIGSEEIRQNICTQLGVLEGRCQVYKTEELIEKIKEKLVFDEEEEEVISLLAQQRVELNIYDYRLDEILADVEAIEVIENYGEGYIRG